MPGKGIRLLLVVALFAVSQTTGGSNLASISHGDIRFGIDTAVYDCAGGDTLGLEVYQQLDLSQLSTGQDSMAVFNTLVVLISVDGDTLAVDQWNSETQWAQGRSIVNCTVLPVIPGEYLLNVTVTDNRNGRQGTLSRELSVDAPEHISEIELARAVVPAQAGSQNTLRKGEVIMFPAASGTYTLPAEHMIYYYVELYDAGGETLSMQSRLETSSGETIYARPWAPLAVPESANAVGLVDSLDLRVVRNPGLHRMIFGIVMNGDTLEVEKLLMVGRTAEIDSDPADVSQDEILEVKYSDQFRMILSSSELAVYDNLNEDSRIRYYSAYWQDFDEHLQHFEDRCAYSERYTTPFREGWETDRGRVSVLYGIPDDIDTYLFHGEMVPYEIWYYLEGMNESFVFADRWETGEYEQLFSTMEGEISYSNWEEMLSPIQYGSEGGGSFATPGE